MGGLIVSQLLTLYTTPVIYLFFDRSGTRFSARAGNAPGADVITPGPVPRRHKRDECLRDFRSQTSRDHAAHRRHCAFRRDRVPIASGVAVATSRLSYHLGSTGLPGASPETMASSVATPLERQFGHIASVSEMTSSSSLGHHQHYAPVRSESRYRRCGTRRGIGHQCSARLSARKSSRAIPATAK